MGLDVTFPCFYLACVYLYACVRVYRGGHTLVCTWVLELEVDVICLYQVLFALCFEIRPLTETGVCPFAWDHWYPSFFFLALGHRNLTLNLSYVGSREFMSSCVSLECFASLLTHSSQVSLSDSFQCQSTRCCELCTDPHWQGRAEKEMSRSEFCLRSELHRILSETDLCAVPWVWSVRLLLVLYDWHFQAQEGWLVYSTHVLHIWICKNKFA